MQQRRVFTEEFKRDAVRLAKERGNTSAVARDLGINESLLSKWKHKLETTPERPFPGQGNPQDQELAQLKRDLARLKEENEILKKAVGIFSVRPQKDTAS
jgi:transposase